MFLKLSKLPPYGYVGGEGRGGGNKLALIEEGGNRLALIEEGGNRLAK